MKEKNGEKYFDDFYYERKMKKKLYRIVFLSVRTRVAQERCKTWHFTLKRKSKQTGKKEMKKKPQKRKRKNEKEMEKKEEKEPGNEKEIKKKKTGKNE